MPLRLEVLPTGNGSITIKFQPHGGESREEILSEDFLAHLDQVKYKPDSDPRFQAIEIFLFLYVNLALLLPYILEHSRPDNIISLPSNPLKRRPFKKVITDVLINEGCDASEVSQYSFYSALFYYIIEKQIHAVYVS